MAKHILEKTPQNIDCSDLTAIPRFQFAIELLLPLPWLGLSLVLYSGVLWPLGVFGSFMFFLCCLRLNHEAIHNNLGLSRRWDCVIMHGLSAVMIGSNHADAFCHLKHHRDTLGPYDHEGHCAHMTFWQVFRYGPRFPVELNRAAWKAGSAFWRKRIAVDWICVGAFAVIVLLSGERLLLFHLMAMIAGQCMTAFFAVWITHQGTQGRGIAGRSQRGLVARLGYLMFYHREHHLFPKVPVSRLPELAKRLDGAVPGYADARMAVTPIFDWKEG